MTFSDCGTVGLGVVDPIVDTEVVRGVPLPWHDLKTTIGRKTKKKRMHPPAMAQPEARLIFFLVTTGGDWTGG
jgi:hypothetical protein